MASVCWRTIVRVKGYVHLCKNAQPPIPICAKMQENPIPSPKLCAFLHSPRPRGRGFWAHYSPIVPIPGFVGVIRERDQVVWLLFGGDIDHTTLGFFHDFAQFCEDLVFGHGFDVFVCDV